MRKKRLLSPFVIGKSGLLLFGLSLAMSITAQVTIDINAGKRGATIGTRHYGIFYEEINHAGDGGLYAELIQNRSFEDDTDSPVKWSAVGGASISLITDDLLNEVQEQALQLTITSMGGGVSNEGYWGINIVSGQEYKLTLWAKSEEGYSGTLTAYLFDSEGNSLGTSRVASSLTSEWTKYEATITPTGSDPEGYFALKGSRTGTICLDVVSLMPPTWNDHGCRIDLAEMLDAMNPAFVRFPGGCYIEGYYSDGDPNRFEWKKTIGPIEERPGHFNNNWGYQVTDGFGFHEMLQLTEDLGAEPLFVVNIGIGHDWAQAYNDLEDYIQEALDAIEYCNGDITTTWGALRAENGHPEPFNLRLIEIGNENYSSGNYSERYYQFYNAIKAKYPEIECIGNVAAWGTDTPVWDFAYPTDMVDEHYYRSPDWFVGKYNMYDSYDRNTHKVYVGEYAVTSDYGTYGNLAAALGEAVYMEGMERNSDVVVMNSYAPIFVNENDYNWQPDMIRFNSYTAYGTPSYYVQQLFPNNVGKQNVKWTETNNVEDSETGYIGLSTWNTTVKYDNLKVSDLEGNVLLEDDFSTSTGSAWTNLGSTGSWSVTDGCLYQSSSSMTGAMYKCTSVEPGSSYILELDATKVSGDEGFLVAFNVVDADNYVWWNLGGWTNTLHGVEICTDGTKSTLTSTSGTITTGQTYHIKIVVDGASVQCWLDDELIHEFELSQERKVYVSANIDEDEGLLYVKLVNPYADAQSLQLNFTNCTPMGGSVITLSSASNLDENSTDNPYNVAPDTIELAISGDSILFDMPAYGLCILRINVEDITMDTDEATETSVSSLNDILRRFNYLHGDVELPTQTEDFESITWSYTPEEGWEAMASLSGNTFQVASLPEPGEEAVKAGVLTATLPYTTGTYTQAKDVYLAPDDGVGYLFCHMTSNGGEYTAYALGTKEDNGFVFNELLEGDEIMNTAELSTIEGGQRDAFIGRGQEAEQYFMTTTDMKQAVSGVWNNYGLDLLRSADLINWEAVSIDFRKGKQAFSDSDETTEAYTSDEEYANITRVWAPQFIYDPAAQAYLVYYSLLSTNDGDTYDKIYYSYTDDFLSMTQPRVLYDPGFSVIDADITFNPYDSLYHMLYKREGASGSDRGVYEATSPTLVSGEWIDVLHITNEGTAQVEGASMIRRINEEEYNIYYMRYSDGSAYKFCTADMLCLNPGYSEALNGTGSFQHGSFMYLTETEYTLLQAWSDLVLLLPDVEALADAEGLSEETAHTISEAVAQAENALAQSGLSTLAVKIPAALEALEKAVATYNASLVENFQEGDTIDLTELIVNPEFADGTEGWEGSDFTALSYETPEFWNKNFDRYQILSGMPAGTYLLVADGFYRYGSITHAYEAHTAGTEVLNAKLYINSAETPLMSLYDESTESTYTYSSYTYPDNLNQAYTAMNVTGMYQDNTVEYAIDTTADLRIGVKNKHFYTNDWAAFDNFRLFYIASPTAESITAVQVADEVQAGKVYTLSGQSVPAGTSLTKGLYIIDGKKVLVR